MRLHILFSAIPAYVHVHWSGPDAAQYPTLAAARNAEREPYSYSQSVDLRSFCIVLYCIELNKLDINTGTAKAFDLLLAPAISRPSLLTS
jgi:hypothetical protein